MYFLARYGPALDAGGQHKNLARFVEGDGAIPQLDVEGALEHKSRVKTLCRRGRDEAGLRCELLFPAFDYARIAAISGWMPMMFITRVRL